MLTPLWGWHPFCYDGNISPIVFFIELIEVLLLGGKKAIEILPSIWREEIAIEILPSIWREEIGNRNRLVNYPLYIKIFITKDRYEGNEASNSIVDTDEQIENTSGIDETTACNDEHKNVGNEAINAIQIKGSAFDKDIDEGQDRENCSGIY
jgi:hypothetical protein